jgi:hypothetical protein
VKQPRHHQLIAGKGGAVNPAEPLAQVIAGEFLPDHLAFAAMRPSASLR